MCRQGGDEVDVPIAIVSVDSQADQPEATMTRAYQALYAAKRVGRDRARWH
jgi:GGDEF domain-containing protein